MGEYWLTFVHNQSLPHQNGSGQEEEEQKEQK